MTDRSGASCRGLITHIYQRCSAALVNRRLVLRLGWGKAISSCMQRILFSHVSHLPWLHSMTLQPNSHCKSSGGKSAMRDPFDTFLNHLTKLVILFTVSLSPSSREIRIPPATDSTPRSRNHSLLL